MGIITTDTKPKLAMSECKIGNTNVKIYGIAKGSGMIQPNMATTLGYIFTDADIPNDLLKKLLKMNPDLDLTLKYFKPGIEILFPSRDVLETTNFVVDRDAARLFYEVNLYYAAFGQEFNRGTAEIGRLMKSR